MNNTHRIADFEKNVHILYLTELITYLSILLYLERIGKLKNFLLLKEIYNGIKVITIINYGKQTLNFSQLERAPTSCVPVCSPNEIALFEPKDAAMHISFPGDRKGTKRSGLRVSKPRHNCSHAPPRAHLHASWQSTACPPELYVDNPRHLERRGSQRPSKILRCCRADLQAFRIQVSR